MTKDQDQSISPTDAFNAVGEAIDTLNEFLTDEPDAVSTNKTAMRANLADQAKKQFLGKDTVADKMLSGYALLSEEEKYVLEDFAQYDPRTTLNPITNPEVLLALRIQQVKLALSHPESLEMPEMTTETRDELIASLNNEDMRETLKRRFPESMTTETLLRTKTALLEMHQDGLS
jgi:hypothetical protein